MEKFNAVLIGTGNMGKTHLKSALASPYIDKLFLCDTSAIPVIMGQGIGTTVTERACKIPTEAEDD